MTMNILLVEDDPDIREIERKELEAAGHRIYEAGTVLQAENWLNGIPVDVNFEMVVTDLGLPKDVNRIAGPEIGRAFVRWVRANMPTLPVIVVSARSGREVDVSKPWEPGAIAAAVEAKS